MFNKVEMGYVIVDQDDNFVSDRVFTLTDEGWLYSWYTGIDSGFVSFTNKEAVNKYTKKLQDLSDKYGFGKFFKYKYMNVNSIPMGKFIIDEVKSLCFFNEWIK